MSVSPDPPGLLFAEQGYVEVRQVVPSCSIEGGSSKIDVNSFLDFPVHVPGFIVNCSYSVNHWFANYNIQNENQPSVNIR